MNTRPPVVYNFHLPRFAARLITGVVIVILLVILIWTACYTVQAESEGVVLRFGKFLKTVEPGLHFKLPFGIDEVIVVPTRRQLKLEFASRLLDTQIPTNRRKRRRKKGQWSQVT